jgi:hypothetical protein
MIWIARIYAALMMLLFAGLGAFALAQPDALAVKLALMPKTIAGTAELRGLYGGAFLSWAALGLAAWRFRSLRTGILAALGVSLGGIAIARLVSLAVDHEAAFNVPALITEGLFAVACWALVKDEQRRV